MANMREKYETLSLIDLKEIAKVRGIKGVSAMKKAAIIEAMVAKDEEESKAAPAPAAPAAQPAKPAAPAASAPAASAEKKVPVAFSPAPVHREEGEKRKSDNEQLGEDEIRELDSGQEVGGILEVMQDGFGFIRCENFLPGQNDIYVAPSQIRRFGLKTGDILKGHTRIKTEKEKFAALLYLTSVNGFDPESTTKRRKERQPRSLQNGTFNNLVGDIIDLRNANRPHRIVNKIHLLLLREIWLVLKKRLPQKLLPVHPRGGIVDGVDN